MYQPSWAKHEKDVSTVTGAQAFVDEREREMAADPKAKEWEQSRRRSLNRQKHDYSLKEQTQEQEEMNRHLTELKNGGEFDENLEPRPGFILVKVDEKAMQTDSGFKLPESLNPDPNTGVVVAITPLWVQSVNSITILSDKNVRVGEKILFKKGAGIDVVIKGESLKLMRCVEDIMQTDVLGVFR